MNAGLTYGWTKCGRPFHEQHAGDKTIFVTEVAKHFNGAKNILCTAGDAAHDDETTP
jgi:hypothetical protein